MPRLWTRFVRRLKAATDGQIARASDIPVVSLGRLLGERRPVIQFAVGRYVDGTIATNELVALLAILVDENPREILEIGTFMGHTTRAMAESLPDATIHTVDLPAEYPATGDPGGGFRKDDLHLIRSRDVGREFRDRPCAARIRQYLADTATWNFASAGQPTGFFIDGSHTYEYCRNDSEKCLTLGGGRGVFLWHDCSDEHPGVLRLLAEWRRKGRDIRRVKGTSLAYWKAG